MADISSRGMSAAEQEALFDAFEAEDHDDQADCPNCGGEGWVSDCWEEYACVDPEGGCDACMVRCDWCNRPPAPTHQEASR